MSSEERTLLQISSFGRFRFSQPKAVSSPTRSRIVCASGSLQHQSGTSACLTGVHSVNQQLSFKLAFVIAAEHAGKTGHQRRFSSAGSAQQQHALPGCMVKSTCLNAKSLREACRHPQSRATTPAAENDFSASVPMNRSFIPLAFRVCRTNTYQKKSRIHHCECDTGLHQRIVIPRPSHGRIRNGQARLF